MARIRTIKPEFFRNESLQDLESDNPGQYIMLVFAGLWTIADSQGIFKWKPRYIKLDVLPFLEFSMEKTLAILETHGFVTRYKVDGEEYGRIPTFLQHQRLSGKEASEGKRYPCEAVENQQSITKEATEKQQGSTGEATGKHPDAQEKEREKERILGKEKKEKEGGMGETNTNSTTTNHFPHVGKKVEPIPIPSGIQSQAGAGAPRPLDWQERPVEDIVQQLKEDQQFMDVTCMNFRIDPSILPEWIDRFSLWRRNKDGPNATVKDVRQHLCSWLAKQDLTENPKLPKNGKSITKNGTLTKSGSHSGFDILDAELEEYLQDAGGDSAT